MNESLVSRLAEFDLHYLSFVCANVCNLFANI